MDPSSPYAMQRLIGLKDRFDIAFACDTDHDRHGIVTRSAGLLPPNHYLAVAIDYLFQHRPQWGSDAAVGKTVVSSAMIDRVAAAARPQALRSAGRLQMVRRRPARRLARLRRRGKRGRVVPAPRRHGVDHRQGRHRRRRCSSAEITARTGRDPGELYRELDARARRAGRPTASTRRRRAEQKRQLAQAVAAAGAQSTELAGEPIERVLDRAPGNDAPIGGIKVIAASGWFAARPSGTEDIYKIYAESFQDEEHLQSILEEAQSIVDGALAAR